MAILRILLALFFVAAGAMHFLSPEPYLHIMPAYLPAPLLLVYLSGVGEIAGGVGVLVPGLRRIAGYGLIALLIAVFPANVNMALNHISLSGLTLPVWLLWLRLPLQALLIAWVWFCALRPAAFERVKLRTINL
jgi:uncharacterized membrane protein